MKPQTLYAYVSRGLVRRERPPGSRTSRYARADVERLAEHGRPRTRAAAPEIAIDQAVTSLDPAGHLAYRGWDVTARPRPALATRRSRPGSGVRPSGRTSTGARDRAELAIARAGAGGAARRHAAPRPAARDRRRAALGRSAPQRPAAAPRSRRARARIIATLVEALPPVDARDEPTRDRVARAPALDARRHRSSPTSRRGRARSTARCRCSPTTSSRRRRSAVRVAASTWADPVPAPAHRPRRVGGPLHGGASEFVRTLLRDAVATTPEAAVGQALRDGEHVPGFGHSVYEGPDPRAPVLLDAVERCKPPRELWRAAQGVLDVMARDGGPHPNIDFALGVLGEATRMVHGAGEAIFAVARSAGWIAHGLEEYPHRLRYRIRATYTGPGPPSGERRQLARRAAGGGGRGSRRARSRRGCRRW